MKAVAGPVVIPARYELKYTIPDEQVADISAFVEPYCSLDYHSSISPDSFYQVNSLYFDSPDFILLRNRLAGLHDRFNMRVRTYGAAPKEPWFLEVKRKIGEIVRKYRARVKEGDLARILDIGEDVGPYLMSPGDAGNAERFRRLAHAYNAVPVVQTTYRRKAYFSTCDDYARVTFDKELRFHARDVYDPRPAEDDFAPSDVETVFDDGASVVLELKCPSKEVPLWMLDLIRKFDLRRRGFSKYSAGMAQVFRRYEFDPGNRMPSSQAFGGGAEWD